MATKLLAYILAAVLAPGLAIAAPITSLYVVGDSLSDQGNGFLLTGGAFPPLPYDQRASNGPVAVEYLANALGVPLAPAASGGTNYAVLGAATGAVGIPSSPPLTTENVAAILYGQAALEGTGLLSQTGEILAAGPIADPGALFFVWGGANDLFIDPSAATVGNAINNLAVVISLLYGGGARQFLVPNLPDLSRTPSGLSLPPAAAELDCRRCRSASTRVWLVHSMASLSCRVSTSSCSTRSACSTRSWPTQVLSASATPRCRASPGTWRLAVSVCADPGSYLFWDSVHPTTAAHAVLGNAFAAAVAEPVPEPASIALLSLGIGLAAAARRRRAS